MRRDKKETLFCQTIQDTIALYYLLPIRTLSMEHTEEIFLYINEHKLLGRKFKTRSSLLESIEAFLKSLPNFLHAENLPYTPLPPPLSGFKLHHIRHLRDLLYLSKSSFNPFFMAALDTYLPIKIYKMLFYLKLLFSLSKENTLKSHTFFNFHYCTFYMQKRLFLIGPIMVAPLFNQEPKRLAYIKAIKNHFSLDLHTYELLNMLNQRDPLPLHYIQKRSQQIKKSLFIALQNHQNAPHEKQKLRELATHFLVQSNNPKKLSNITENIVYSHSFFKTFSKIKNNQIRRDLEALEWFNDLTFQNLSFESTLECFDTKVLNYLQNMLQADSYFLCSYEHYCHKLSLMHPHHALLAHHKEEIETTLHAINKDPTKHLSSYTYQVIHQYQTYKNPIYMVKEQEKSPHSFAIQKAVSILSIPLVFDKRVFSVLHFVAFTKGRFDEIDKRFLLKLSSALSKRYIEYHLHSCLDQTLTILEGLNRVKEPNYLKQKSDQVCQNIAKAFCCDGVIIWFNQKELFHTPKEANKLTILSQINFLNSEEILKKRDFPIDLSNDESLLVRHADDGVTVIDDIQNRCSNNPKDRFFMKYKKTFLEKKIQSIMFVAIKNIDGKFSGAVMLFDKEYRNYSPLSKRMLKRISIYMGSILNTVTYARYQNQKLDERNLHESAQYLNVINSRAKDLERILQRFHLPQCHDKHRLFLNIEDIKDFTQYARTYLFTLFTGGAFLKKYDELVAKNLHAIHKNSTYTSLQKILNQVLAVHKTQMHQSKDIFYRKHLTYNLEIKIPSQQMLDILSNLINNAIKYGKQGKYIKIWDEKSFNYYNLYIENIGYPILQQERERIFEKGARGYITKTVLANKEEFNQTLSANKGLGLYISKTLMKQGLGGNVILQESTPFGTSEFHKNVFVIKFPKKITRKPLCKKSFG